MTTASATSDSIAVTLNKWYHFSARANTRALNDYSIRLRYNTEAVDEFDTGAVEGMGAAVGFWNFIGYCFKAQYTDADFIIILEGDDGDRVDFITEEDLPKGYRYNIKGLLIRI